MNGKICLVTGATSGIGAATAKALAGMGATVVVVGRNPNKAAAITSEIRRQTGNPSIAFLLADLSSQSDVRRLAEQVESRYERLDVLINNAGAFYTNRQLSIDGIEMTFAVDYLAPFLLTNLLLDRLKASTPSRVINVSSETHRRAKIDFDNLQGQRGYNGFWAYGQAKLALLLFTYELARRLRGTGVTVNALHPGLVATGIAMNNPWPTRLMWRMVTLFAISPEQGAETSVYLATSPEVEGVTGQYFDKKKAVRSSDASYDEATARRLWELSLEMTGLPPSVQQAT